MLSILVNTTHLPLPPTSFPSTHRHCHRNYTRSTQWKSSMSSDPLTRTTPLAMDFPYLSPAHKHLMSDLLSTMDTHLRPRLLPSEPIAFQNDSGTSKGALDIVSGVPGSPIDFILQSWIHCELPFGTLNITTLFAFLSPTATDAPHLLMEFIQSSPTSLVLLMDLLPRRDVVLHQDYLHRFYEETQLDNHRQSLEKNLTGMRPYVSSSLFIRSVLSPTAIAMNIKCEAEEEMEEVMGVGVGAAARGMAGAWMERCVVGGGGGKVEGVEELRKRDGMIKKKAIEIDLTANLPRLFGQEVADRVVLVIQKAFGV